MCSLTSEVTMLNGMKFVSLKEKPTSRKHQLELTLLHPPDWGLLSPKECKLSYKTSADLIYGALKSLKTKSQISTSSNINMN